jgi:hypothetical protein
MARTGPRMQVERFGSVDAFQEQIDREMAASGIQLARGMKWWQDRRYRKTALEQEAESIANRHGAELALCRARAVRTLVVAREANALRAVRIVPRS